MSKHPPLPIPYHRVSSHANLDASSDENNFINFCQGKELTDGQQITTGSCNGIPMGNIPAVENMISALITNPQAGSQISSDTTFDIMVQTTHLTAGNFVNPTTNYYTAPQDLDNNGDIIGHCHVTVQDIGSMDSTTPPDPSTFAFFKGIDDAGDGNGLLSATVEGGLPPGTYRVCTMIAAQNHQPVAMPVAQRGAQDDCTKFEVVDDGTGGEKSQNQDQDMTQNQDEEGFVVDGDGVNDNEQGGEGDENQGGNGGGQEGNNEAQGDNNGNKGDQSDGGRGDNGNQGNNRGEEGNNDGQGGNNSNQEDTNRSQGANGNQQDGVKQQNPEGNGNSNRKGGQEGGNQEQEGRNSGFGGGQGFGGFGGRRARN